MTIPIPHHSVRIILLNSKNEVLLMKAEDPKTTEPDGSYHGPFWFLIGGEIEPGEDLATAAYREVFEETGLNRTDIQLGPEVWNGEFLLVLSGKKRLMKQRFLLARTSKDQVNLNLLTDSEKQIVKKLDWFSLDKMERTEEVIYPVGLSDYLSPIIEGKIPQQPIKVRLDRKPIRREEVQANIKMFTSYLNPLGIGLKRKTVGLSAYNKEWKDCFTWVSKQILSALKASSQIGIYHIGSSSIEGLCAKPILDILIVFQSSKNQIDAINPLSQLGFIHKGDGIARVTNCKPDPNRHFYAFYDTAKEIDYIHLHTYVEGHPDIDKLIKFRDRLRSDPEARDEYGKQKIKMHESGTQRKDYTKSKKQFVDDIVSTKDS